MSAHVSDVVMPWAETIAGFPRTIKTECDVPGPAICGSVSRRATVCVTRRGEPCRLSCRQGTTWVAVGASSGLLQWVVCHFTNRRISTRMFSKDDAIGLLYIPAGFVLIAGIVAAMFLLVLPA